MAYLRKVILALDDRLTLIMMCGDEVSTGSGSMKGLSRKNFSQAGRRLKIVSLQLAVNVPGAAQLPLPRPTWVNATIREL
jgi:hypothetical protein